MLTPKFKIILFKGKQLKDGKRPIMLQVKKADNDYKRISLGMSAKECEWNQTDARFRGTKHQSFNRDLADYEALAGSIVEKMFAEMRKERKPFSFNEFKDRFLGKQSASDKPQELLPFLKWYMDYLKEKDRIGDWAHYQTLYGVLEDFGVNSKLELIDINKDWLEKFEMYLTKRKSKTTGRPIKKRSIRNYIATLRTLFNKAIYFEVTSHYPFKNNANPKGYSFAHLKSARISKSISDEELQLFLNFDWEKGTRIQQQAWKIAFFIYIFRGMPIADAARLTKEDISNNEVVFARVKTHNKVPNIPLSHEKRKWILDLFEGETDGYHLVPILYKDRHITELQIRNRVHKITRDVNVGLREIAKIQGIKSHLTTYVFRHSFSRKVLNKYGVWHLKEVLGHASVETTQSYAGSLSNEELNETDSVFG